MSNLTTTRSESVDKLNQLIIPLQKFSIVQLPALLFKEVAQSVGLHNDPSNEVSETYCVYRLNPNHPAVDFEAVLELIREPDWNRSSLVIWKGMPEKRDDVFSNRPIARVAAGPAETGVWVRGSGNAMKEQAWAQFEQVRGNAISVRSPAFKFISLLFLRASQLAYDPNLVQKEFWENGQPR